jgi:hypothetical protein
MIMRITRAKAPSDEGVRRACGSSVSYVEEMTSDAPARKHFTESGWRKTITELEWRGFREQKIIELMKSNHMMFAINAALKQKSRYTSVDALRYLDTPNAYGKWFTPMYYKDADLDMLFDFTSVADYKFTIGDQVIR